jgi:hypothetical protein
MMCALCSSPSGGMSGFSFERVEADRRRHFVAQDGQPFCNWW